MMTPAGSNLLAAAERGLTRVAVYDARLEFAVRDPLNATLRPGVAEALADARQAIKDWKRGRRRNGTAPAPTNGLDVHARLWLAEIVMAACSGKRITPATVRRVSSLAENLAWATAAAGASNRAAARHAERRDFGGPA